jgi:hypothetical protein
MKMVTNFYSNRGTFGAHYIADGAARMVGTGLHFEFSLSLVKLVIFAALFLTMVGWFFCTVRWRDFRISLVRLPKPEKMFLLIGAALIGVCFFTSSSNGYRAIHLLFTLPGLLAMAHMADDTGVRKVAVQTYVLVVALTWEGFFLWDGLFREFIASWIGNPASAFVVRLSRLLYQFAWWQVATVFIAILIGCCSNWLGAPEWRRLLRRCEASIRTGFAAPRTSR